MVLSEYFGLTPDVYIAHDGDDGVGGDGTIANPYATTTKAIAETSAGDVIGLKDGTYTYAVGDFDMDADRTFVGQSFTGVVINGSALASAPANYIICGTSGIEVDIINIWFKSFLMGTSSNNNSIFKINSGKTSSGLVTFKQNVFSDIEIDGWGGGGVAIAALFGTSSSSDDGVRMKTVDCIMYDILRFDTDFVGQIFKSWAASSGYTYYYENIGLTLILTATGTDAIDALIYFGSESNTTVKNRNCVIANYSGVTTDVIKSGTMDTDNNIYYEFDNTGTLGADDSTDDPKLIDPEFTSLTDPDDIKLAFRPQAGSPAIGAGVAI